MISVEDLRGFYPQYRAPKNRPGWEQANHHRVDYEVRRWFIMAMNYLRAIGASMIIDIDLGGRELAEDIMDRIGHSPAETHHWCSDRGCGVRVMVGDDSAPLPKELAHIDFAVLMENAVLMSHGRLPMVVGAPDPEAIDVEPAPGRGPITTAPEADHTVVRFATHAAVSGNTRPASGSSRPTKGAPSWSNKRNGR
ncbi:hypothetical protein [Nocardia sp. NPDC052316]|uniref:hypothetical protein n=1 Tax=Nocardia sp. NPDC052316 TaxID=3364329 RepID=UPI0037CB569D